MKKTFYIKTALVAVMATTLFSSCLKDTTREYHFADNAPVVDFGAVALSGALQTATISKAAATNTINAVITIGAPHDYTTPTAVTTAIDAASMTATYGATYTLLPATVYTVTPLTVNIIPGIQQRIEAIDPFVGTPVTLGITLGAVSFTINTAAFQALPAATYMIPLTITGASGNNTIVDQFHTIFIKIAVGP